MSAAISKGPEIRPQREVRFIPEYTIFLIFDNPGVGAAAVGLKICIFAPIKTMLCSCLSRKLFAEKNWKN